MANYVYETHIIKNPLLPFIFYPNFEATRPDSLPNWHENIEILSCVSGEGYVKCGLETFPFACGDIFVVNADTPHAVCSESAVTYHCLIVDNSFFTANGIPVSTLYFQNTIHNARMNALFEEVKSAFDRYDPNGICAAADIRYAVLGLLRMLCGSYVVRQPKDSNSTANEHIKKALTYIRKNISSPISLDDMAYYVGISKFHLSREFKAFTGRTVISTVNLIRCSEAKRLIEGGMSVSAAAGFCGFENLSYFSRTFKRLFDTLPSALTKSGKTVR